MITAPKLQTARSRVLHLKRTFVANLRRLATSDEGLARRAVEAKTYDNSVTDLAKWMQLAIGPPKSDIEPRTNSAAQKNRFLVVVRECIDGTTGLNCDQYQIASVVYTESK